MTNLKVKLIIICIDIYLSFNNTEGQNNKKLKASLGSWELRRLSDKFIRFYRISSCLHLVTSGNRPEGD